MKKCLKCHKKVHAKGLCSPHYSKRRRELNPNRDWEYEKTFSGYLMRIFRNMLSRIEGVQKMKYHLYKGKSLLPKKDFYAWAKNHPIYKGLYASYVAHNYDQKLAPSVDRINPDRGYELDNMEWVTHSENSRRSSITRKRLK